jgi:hypothetical protein
MAESLAELLSRLRFVGGPVETLYLNETVVRENFIGQLGEIESFARRATKEGSAEAPVVKIGAKVSSETEVTWSLDDPITQVLVLRTALASEGSLDGLDDTRLGRYILFSGVGMISRSPIYRDLHRERLQGHPGLYEALEAERATQETVLHMTTQDSKPLWLLTVTDGASVCASTLDGSWVRPAIRHWVDADDRWEIFAVFHRYDEKGVAWLTTLHVGVKW